MLPSRLAAVVVLVFGAFVRAFRLRKFSARPARYCPREARHAAVTAIGVSLPLGVGSAARRASRGWDPSGSRTGRGGTSWKAGEGSLNLCPHRLITLDGHRRSRLYRVSDPIPQSSWFKYSGRGREGWPSRMARSAMASSVDIIISRPISTSTKRSDCRPWPPCPETLAGRRQMRGSPMPACPLARRSSWWYVHMRIYGQLGMWRCPRVPVEGGLIEDYRYHQSERGCRENHPCRSPRHRRGRSRTHIGDHRS